MFRQRSTKSPSSDQSQVLQYQPNTPDRAQGLATRLSPFPTGLLTAPAGYRVAHRRSPTHAKQATPVQRGRISTIGTKGHEALSFYVLPGHFFFSFFAFRLSFWLSLGCFFTSFLPFDFSPISIVPLSFCVQHVLMWTVLGLSSLVKAVGSSKNSFWLQTAALNSGRVERAKCVLDGE